MKFFSGCKYACLPTIVIWAIIFVIGWLISSCSPSPFRSQEYALALGGTQEMLDVIVCKNELGRSYPSKS
jgi:hypothetical protein